jgi:hypothetical protein
MTDRTNSSAWEPVWEAPPEIIRRGRSVWFTRLQALVDNKGQWAKIAEYESKGSAHNLRTHLKSRRYRIPEPDGNWEFTVRDGSVYARYNGSAA